MTDYLIRKAEEGDCDQIMKLSVELAEILKMPEEVRTNADVLRKDGFGSDCYFQCLVAETNGTGDADHGRTVIGYCLFYYIYYAWEGKACYMEHLYVTPEWRSKGVGTALWAEVTKIALSKGCFQLHCAVLDWNTGAIELYKRHGGVDITQTEGWHLFRMTKSVMENFVAKNGAKH